MAKIYEKSFVIAYVDTSLQEIRLDSIRLDEIRFIKVDLFKVFK